jgi:hypothetical protein
MSELIDILKKVRWHIVVLLFGSGLLYLISALLKAHAMSGPVSAEWFAEEHRVHQHLIFSVLLFAASGIAAELLKDKYK